MSFLQSNKCNTVRQHGLTTNNRLHSKTSGAGDHNVASSGEQKQPVDSSNGQGANHSESRSGRHRGVKYVACETWSGARHLASVRGDNLILKRN